LEAPLTNNERILNHLQVDYTEPIRDPLWQNITFSRPFMKVIQLEPFQNLGAIRQLGPTHQVYPGALHSRLNHSLGVFHMAKRIIQALLSHTGGTEVSLEGVKAFLCASLLHDLGHFPFAHSLKELPLKDHEVLTGEFILSEPLKGTIRDSLGIRPETVAAIVDDSLPDEGASEILFFRKLLSGVLDPDKLDYLNRDAFFCGVPYGIQDTDYAISKMRPHTGNGIALDFQGLTAAENILFSKYLMYRSVYWHKTVRISTAMIKKPLVLAFEERKVKPEELYWLDDSSFFRKFTGDRFRAFRLIQLVLRRKLFKSVFETDFDITIPLHKRLEDLNERALLEHRIVEKLSSRVNRSITPESVIIDIPEPISFEIDIPILKGESSVPFMESGTLFDRPVVEGFTKTLRKIRIFVEPEITEALDDWTEVFQWIK
jgi:HD superfamily phosphohydrolase